MKRNTVQKRIILDTLREMNCHASAGMVHAKISERYPTISLGTVYRVLSDAAVDGELLRLHFTKTDDRFDITLPPHPHAVCVSCGFVDDVQMREGWDSPDNVLAAGRDPDNPFYLEHCSIEWTGLCAACRKALAEAEPTEDLQKNTGESR